MLLFSLPVHFCALVLAAAASPCTSVLHSAAAGLIYSMPPRFVASLCHRDAVLVFAVALRRLSLPPRCRAGLCRCFSVRLSTAAQVGPAHCLCAADLTFAFAVLCCARPLLFCPHLCRCCSLPSMAFLCRRASVLVFAAAVLSDSLPPPFASRHGFSLPPRFGASLCRRRSFPNIAMRCRRRANRVRAVACRCNAHRFLAAAVQGVPSLCRRCSWRSSSLPAQINPMHIMASAARSCALLTLPPLSSAKLRISMPPRFHVIALPPPLSAGQCFAAALPVRAKRFNAAASPR